MGVDVLIVAAAAFALTASIASLVSLPLPLAVIALRVAPPTRRAFHDAGDAAEEWGSS